MRCRGCSPLVAALAAVLLLAGPARSASSTPQRACTTQGSNVIPGGDFEAGSADKVASLALTAGPEPTVTTEQAHAGEHALHTSAETTANVTLPLAGLTANARYVLSFWTKALAAPASGSSLWLVTYQGGLSPEGPTDLKEDLTPSLDPAAGWVQHQYQVVPSGSEYVVVLQSLGVDWGLDDLSLQPGKCVASCLQTQQQDSGIGEVQQPMALVGTGGGQATTTVRTKADGLQSVVFSFGTNPSCKLTCTPESCSSSSWLAGSVAPVIVDHRDTQSLDFTLTLPTQHLSACGFSRQPDLPSVAEKEALASNSSSGGGAVAVSVMRGGILSSGLTYSVCGSSSPSLLQKQAALSLQAASLQARLSTSKTARGPATAAFTTDDAALCARLLVPGGAALMGQYDVSSVAIGGAVLPLPSADVVDYATEQAGDGSWAASFCIMVNNRTVPGLSSLSSSSSCGPVSYDVTATATWTQPKEARRRLKPSSSALAVPPSLYKLDLQGLTAVTFSCPPPPPTSSTGGKRVWAPPASLPASYDQSKGKGSAKSLSDGAAAGIAIAVLCAGAAAGAGIMIALKWLANRPRAHQPAAAAARPGAGRR